MAIKESKSVKYTQEQIIEHRLVVKSIDAFLFAIEIINKPTIKYRTENFVFNVCNAWELILKAQIVRDLGEPSIYFKNNKDRTISLQNCLDIIFTDFKNPVKLNIELISKIRNKSTHFITPEYDGLYISFFQANVLYYVEHIKEKFNVNINNKLPSNFLTIATNHKDIQDIRILNKVDINTFNSFRKMQKDLMKASESSGVAVSFEMRVMAVKKNPDLSFKIDSNADLSAQVINRILDPSNSHPYRQKDIIEKINNEIGEGTLNQYSFRCIRVYEKLEDSLEFFYYHKQSSSKTYSEKAYTLIKKNIISQPNYIEICIKENKKVIPGARDF